MYQNLECCATQAEISQLFPIVTIQHGRREFYDRSPGTGISINVFDTDYEFLWVRVRRLNSHPSLQHSIKSTNHCLLRVVDHSDGKIDPESDAFLDPQGLARTSAQTKSVGQKIGRDLGRGFFQCTEDQISDPVGNSVKDRIEVRSDDLFLPRQPVLEREAANGRSLARFRVHRLFRQPLFETARL